MEESSVFAFSICAHPIVARGAIDLRKTCREVNCARRTTEPVDIGGRSTYSAGWKACKVLCDDGDGESAKGDHGVLHLGDGVDFSNYV